MGAIQRMKAYCEYLTNPVGIDTARPRFSWSPDGIGGRQASWRIRVYRDDPSASNGDKLVWDSGRVFDARMNNIPYGGARLESAERYDWRVDCVDADGGAQESGVGHFVTGIMDPDGWKAQTVGGPGMEIPAFLFRTEFTVKKPLRTACLCVASGNYNVVTVNGRRCTDAVLQNANTDPEKTLPYAVYPVESLLHVGQNAVGVSLGNGWKALNMGTTGVGVGEHAFSCQLSLRYADGEQEWVYGRADDWFYTKEGPISLNSIYQGECYDATRERVGWDMPGYDMHGAAEAWFHAVEFEPDGGALKAQAMEPIRVVREIAPVAAHPMADGSVVFDMGQNFAGWARLRVSGARGQTVRLVYSELIHEDWTLNQITLRDMRATDEYTLRGEGVEVYEPSFTFHGFRYVQVFGLPEDREAEAITGCVVRSDVAQIGSFECDDALINQLQRNICWTEESNLHSIPTDCPQRNERLGWINDMTVRNECALYNYRLPALYEKWLRDIRDTQGRVTGAISDTAPFRVYGCRPADPVGASLFLVPWNLYLHYGDVRVIEENYDAAKRFLDYIRRNSTDGIVRWSHMGDWAAPIFDNDIHSIGGGAVSVVTPTRLVATAFFCYENRLVANMAQVLGREAEAEHYRAEASRVSEAFLRAYYDPGTHQVGSGSQGCNTIALYMDIIPEADRAAVLENIVADIRAHDTHITTGNMCSRYIIELLLTGGHADLAYELLTQTSYPSWGYMIENGATTVWERWEQITEEGPQSIMASYNHPMYGAVGVCFYKYLAGIAPSAEGPGYERFSVAPVPPSRMNEVTASVDTCRGRLVSHWHREPNGGLCMEITVPYGATAEVTVPLEGRSDWLIALDGDEPRECDASRGGCRFELESGRHTVRRMTRA